jgi:GT2 family glycosyltransferase
VIRTRNEAARLRLTLASLSRQPVLETIVVDDCSSDATGEVAAEAAREGPVRYLRNEHNIGRSATSNAGARAARGDILLFLDGDTPAGPQLAALHASAHAAQPGIAARGEMLHLRCTRFLLDPETASPRPGEEARLGRMAEGDRQKLKVTRDQVLNDFASIEERAQFGIYPGAGPRRLHDVEVQAMRGSPDCPVLWAASTGSNFSVPRDVFLGTGGFDDALHQNEHREFALRLSAAGVRLRLVEGARTYHLTHRIGWRDPLADPEWEQRFYARHPLPAVKLLSVFWAGFSDTATVPPAQRIESLPELAARAREMSDAQIDLLRAQIPGLAPLPPA